MGLLELSALELGRKIQGGEVSVREATEAALASIAQQNEGNNAFITVLREQALAEAEAIQQKISAGELTGPLAGVPWESRITSVPGGSKPPVPRRF